MTCRSTTLRSPNLAGISRQIMGLVCVGALASHGCTLAFGSVGALTASSHNEEIVWRKAAGEKVEEGPRSVGKNFLGFGAVGLVVDAVIFAVAWPVVSDWGPD
jgi:hypothetical protein